MVRNYKRKTERGKYGNEKLTSALEAVRAGIPVAQASRHYGIPQRTLKRHKDGLVATPGQSNLGRHRLVLTSEVERELYLHIKNMERSMYGLTALTVRRLAYEIAQKSGLPNPFSDKTKMAGKDWLAGFLSRHKDLSLRQPQATSLSRVVGFNKPQVKHFFDIYRELLNEYKFQPSRIWNMDETGITNVHKPGKVVATKGTRQVSKVTSGERGQNVTVICAMNAVGSYIPPVFIFPRKRVAERMIAGAPPGSLCFANESGWSDSEQFLKWLNHFVSATNASTSTPQLILLDGHHSHKTLDAVLFAREYGIHLITFPPHCTHKLQPLDRTLFKALKSAYNASADSWLISNPGKGISLYEVAGIFGKAYLRAATQEKAINGFRTCGIWPYDPEVFSDSDFIAAGVTEEQQPQTSTAALAASPAVPDPVQQPQTPESPSVISAKRVLQCMSPIPHISGSRIRARKPEKALVLTSSPNKVLLQEKENTKISKKRNANQMSARKANKSPKKKNLLKHSQTKQNDECFCLVCNEPFSNSRSSEMWVQCPLCTRWAHEECTPGDYCYICHNCE